MPPVIPENRIYNQYGVVLPDPGNLIDRVERVVQEMVETYAIEHELTTAEIRMLYQECYFSFSVAMSSSVLKRSLVQSKIDRDKTVDTYSV